MRPLQESRAELLRDARLDLLRDGKGIAGLVLHGGGNVMQSYMLRPDRLERPYREMALHPVPAGLRVFRHTVENRIALCLQDAMHVRAGFVSPWEDAWWSTTEDGRDRNRRTYYALKAKARRIANSLIGRAIEEAADPVALTVARRFPLSCRSYLYARAAASSRARQLCETFPALAADIYSREIPPPSAALVERGAALKAAAESHEMSMALRRVKPGAVMLAFRCWRVFGYRPDLWHAYLPDTLPAQRLWLRAVTAASPLGPPYMEWTARNLDNFEGRTAVAVVTQVENIGDFVRASYAEQYFGGIPEYVRGALGFSPMPAGVRLVARPFSPDMSLATVQRLSDEWHEATIRHAEKSGQVRQFPDPWVPGAEINGYMFAPITDSAALYREAQNMRNCCATYDGTIIGGEAYLYGVARDGKPVATLELRRGQGDKVALGQVRESCNGPAGKDVMAAARAWLRRSGVTHAPARRRPAGTADEGYDEEIPF